MNILARMLADVSNNGGTDIWSWLGSNVSLQSIFNTAGLGLLVVLFARDLILTKAQHERRVADMVKAHEAELKAKDDRYTDMMAERRDRYSEMKESRNHYRDAYNEMDTRNIALTSGMVESNKAMSVVAKAFSALDSAVKEIDS